jgi:hypothetical protein
MDEIPLNMQTMNRMIPLEANADEMDFSAKCTLIEESLQTAFETYVPKLRELKRNKKEAKEVLIRMKYHVKNALFNLDQLEKYLS